MQGARRQVGVGGIAQEVGGVPSEEQKLTMV
jgi:hypothetical protein